MLYRLHEAGYSAFLVGGCVRDLLLGHHPKDFDIATDALPEEVRKLFRNCRLIGKRFRLAHILFGREIIEVATFRSHHENAAHASHAHSHKGMIVRDNVFGPIEHDAWRRDFSVNALYYNIADFSVIDYTGGMPDIQARQLRMIGEPEKRFHEDPVRLLRAVRFAGKLNLTIATETEVHIRVLSHLLQNVSSARLFTEVVKFFEGGSLAHTFKLLNHYKLLHQLFAQTAECLQHDEAMKLIELALVNTDARLKEGKNVSPAFLFSVFLWHPIKEQAKREEASGLPTYVAYERAIFHVLKHQIKQLAIPRRLQVSIRDICFLQHRFTQRNGNRAFRALEHPRFRAGYDLLMMRAASGEPVKDLYEWWTAFQQADTHQREKMVAEINKNRSTKKRRRHRKINKKPKNSVEQLQ